MLAGFSLVEVAIALGIIGFTILPMVAMLGSGFQTVQQSNSEMRSALIAQKIMGAAQMVPFENLSDTNYQFDLEGVEVPAQLAVFEVSLRVTKNTAGDIISSPNLAKLSVTVTGKALNNQQRGYSGMAANQGH